MPWQEEPVPQHAAWNSSRRGTKCSKVQLSLWTLRISGPDLDYSGLTHKELPHPRNSVGWVLEMPHPGWSLCHCLSQVSCAGQVRCQHHRPKFLGKLFVPLMRLGSIFAPLWQSVHSLDSHSMSLLLPSCCSGFITVVFEQLPLCEWVSTGVLRSSQLHIYFITISPTAAFFFHPFLSYLSNNSLLGLRDVTCVRNPAWNCRFKNSDWVTFP